MKCVLDFSVCLSGARGGGSALIPAVQSEARAAFLFPLEAGDGEGEGGVQTLHTDAHTHVICLNIHHFKAL